MLPPFDEALDQLGAFVKSKGLGLPVVWIFREDAFVNGSKRPWLKPFNRLENAWLVRKLYESCRNVVPGMEIRTYCRVGRDVFCWLFVPEDEVQAADFMIRDLKISMPVDLREGHQLTGGWLDRVRLAGSAPKREDWLIEEMPSREQVRAKFVSAEDIHA